MTRSPPTRAWTSTSAGGGCSSSARTCSPASPTTSCRWRGSPRRRGSRRRCSTTTSPPRRRTSSPRWRRRRPSWQQRTAPDPALPPLEQLSGSLDAYLAWVEENAGSYDEDDPVGGRGARGAGDARPRARRHGAADHRRARGDRPASPVLRTAVNGWLWFMDGACLDWVDHRDLDRETLHGLLLGTLMGAVLAAGEGGYARRLDASRGRRRRRASRSGRSGRRRALRAVGQRRAG